MGCWPKPRAPCLRTAQVCPIPVKSFLGPRRSVTSPGEMRGPETGAGLRTTRRDQPAHCKLDQKGLEWTYITRRRHAGTRI